MGPVGAGVGQAGDLIGGESAVPLKTRLHLKNLGVTGAGGSEFG